MYTSALTVTVFEVTAVVTPWPPATLREDVARAAVVVPLSPVTVLYVTCSTLGESFVIVRLSPLTAVLIPVPPMRLIVAVVLLAVLFPASLPITPVSYTHLTLPTICSV